MEPRHLEQSHLQMPPILLNYQMGTATLSESKIHDTIYSRNLYWVFKKSVEVAHIDEEKIQPKNIPLRYCVFNWNLIVSIFRDDGSVSEVRREPGQCLPTHSMMIELTNQDLMCKAVGSFLHIKKNGCRNEIVIQRLSYKLKSILHLNIFSRMLSVKPKLMQM